MFLELAHTKPDECKMSREFVLSCYQESKNFPSEEKFGIISPIRRAALSVHVNIAEESSRKSVTERKRFYEIARGSLIEVDAALDIAVHLNYFTKETVKELEMLIVRAFQLISKMIR